MAVREPDSRPWGQPHGRTGTPRTAAHCAHRMQHRASRMGAADIRQRLSTLISQVKFGQAARPAIPPPDGVATRTYLSISQAVKHSAASGHKEP
jgi:hypothetical protein